MNSIANSNMPEITFGSVSPPNGWQDVCSGEGLKIPLPQSIPYSVFKSVKSPKIYRCIDSWEELLRRIGDTNGYVSKTNLPLLKLASFGDKLSAHGSLRHDQNVIGLSGVVCDYDGEHIQMEDAAEKLDEAGVECALYPSPSYGPKTPRWRVLAPFREPATGTPDELRQFHSRMVSRINGVLGGVLAPESWAMSQCYYFGRANDAHSYRVVHVAGRCIDTICALDAGAIGKPSGVDLGKGSKATTADAFAMRVAELGRRLRTGDGRRAMLMSSIGAEVNRGTPSSSIKLMVLGVIAKYFDRDDEFDEGNINRIVDDFVANELEQWSDPVPMPSELTPVPTFDLSLLPESLRDWIADIADRMQIGPDIPAIGAVTALSAAIGRRVRITPKVRDRSWVVVPNLWGAVVAPPGYMKSPALSAIMAPLHRLEREAHHAYLRAMSEHEAACEQVAMVNSATKAVAVTKLKKDLNAKVDPLLAEPEAPTPKRYVVNNFSVEALGEVLINNPDGVLAFNDELYGLLKMADKPGNEELHSFLLQAWNGDSGFAFDRIGRGHRYIDYVCVALLGGIQPGRLIDYLISSANGGAADSGFIQRFQLLTWPDIPKEWKLIDREADSVAAARANRIFERVTTLGDGLAEDIRSFEPEAQTAFYDWLEENERDCRNDELPDVMRSHLSKYRSLVPSLALIFAVADGVEGNIPLRYVLQAVGWANYLRPHAERAFACTAKSGVRRAKSLLLKIKSGHVAREFKPADVYLRGWSGLGDPQNVEKATELLCDLGYLRRIERKPQGVRGGRPSVVFETNPKVMTMAR